jgi:ADP-heptose:LPS heptosyltransferase
MKATLITGNVADFLAVESFMTDEERVSLEGVFYATKAHKAIKEIFDWIPTFPNLKNHTVLWDEWGSTPPFENKKQLKMHLLGPEPNYRQKSALYQYRDRINKLDNLLNHVTDFSISVFFPQAFASRQFNGSSLLKHKVADISKLPLPDAPNYSFSSSQHLDFLKKIEMSMRGKAVQRYICVVPYEVIEKDRFNQEDWNHVIGYAESTGNHLVVIAVDNYSVPSHKLIINLSNQITFLQSVEVLKGSRGYIGIDSPLSVLAAQVFTGQNIIIKSASSHLDIWKHVYCAPHKSFGFIVKQVRNVQDFMAL